MHEQHHNHLVTLQRTLQLLPPHPTTSTVPRSLPQPNDTTLTVLENALTCLHLKHMCSTVTSPGATFACTGMVGRYRHGGTWRRRGRGGVGLWGRWSNYHFFYNDLLPQDRKEYLYVLSLTVE